MTIYYCQKHGEHTSSSGCWQCQGEALAQQSYSNEMAIINLEYAESLNRERMRAEEERWLFAQPEDVQRRWLAKKEEEKAAAAAAALAHQQAVENQEREADALRKLNSERDNKRQKLERKRDDSSLGDLIFLYSPIALFFGWAAWMLSTNQPNAANLVAERLLALPVIIIYFWIVNKIYDRGFSLLFWGPAIWVSWEAIQWALNNKPFAWHLSKYLSVSLLIFVTLCFIIHYKKISNLNSKIEELKN